MHAPHHDSPASRAGRALMEETETPYDLATVEGQIRFEIEARQRHLAEGEQKLTEIGERQEQLAAERSLLNAELHGHAVRIGLLQEAQRVLEDKVDVDRLATELAS